jgi:hypothetical protein
MTDTLNNIKTLIPMIRKTMPALMAHQIASVQPMTGLGRSIYRMPSSKEIKKMEKYLNKTYWPYQYNSPYLNFDEVDRWCYEHFKSRNWRFMLNTYAFKRKEDFEWFLLRWT